MCIWVRSFFGTKSGMIRRGLGPEVYRHADALGRAEAGRVALKLLSELAMWAPVILGGFGLGKLGM